LRNWFWDLLWEKGLPVGKALFLEGIEKGGLVKNELVEVIALYL